MQDKDQSSPKNNPQPKLSEADQSVLDRIFNATPEAFVANSTRDDALLNLLNLLDSPVRAELQKNSRIDLVQVLASRIENATDFADLQLSPQDQAALDQYIAQQYQIEQLDPSLKDRAIVCDSIGNHITSGALSPKDDLVNRTLSKIQLHIDQEESALKVESAGWQLSGRWADFVSIAAMLLIVASIALPMMSSVRAKTQQADCFSNMQASANAFGLYAGSNRDMLPMATAGFGPTWMDVGSTPERSNSSNLFTLIRSKNANLEDLACPSNPNAPTGDAKPDAWDWNSLSEISYSYRIMPPGGMRATIAQPVRVVLLADRSPVVLRVAKGLPVIPEENSPNHQSKGQHMLMLDGSSMWSKSPVINDNDNIWLPRPIEQAIHEVRSKLGIIQGTEQPAGPTDAFVGP